MPGLIGLVGTCATLDVGSSAVKSINHFDDYCSKRCSPFNNIEIAQVWRNSTETAGSWHHDRDSGASAFVNGTVIKPGIRPQQMHADEVLQAHLSDNLIPEKYDGSFVIVIADARTRKLIVLNDRLGTLPCYYCTPSAPMEQI